MEHFERSILSRLAANAARVLSAAIAMAVVGFAIAFVAHQERPPHAETKPAEQRGLELADHSLVHLNENTALHVNLLPRERFIRLLRGEARFIVAKDSKRPFIVQTPQATIRALGTTFNVRIQPKYTAITLLEGRVEISRRWSTDLKVLVMQLLNRVLHAGQRTNGRITLEAGQHAIVREDGTVLLDAGPTADQANAWPEKNVTLAQMKLRDLVAELNRYRPHPIVIVDSELAALEVNGTMNVYDPQPVLDYLARIHGVRIQYMKDGRILLMKPRRTRQPDLQAKEPRPSPSRLSGGPRRRH